MKDFKKKQKEEYEEMLKQPLTFFDMMSEGEAQSLMSSPKMPVE